MPPYIKQAAIYLTINWGMYVCVCVYVCLCVCLCVCPVIRFDISRTDSLQIWWAHTTHDHTLHGIHTYHVQAPRASVCVRARMCEGVRDEAFAHFWTDSLQIWWGHTTHPQRLIELFNLCVYACPNCAHQYTFTYLPSPWRAMTSFS
jgi:hypothetical protein